MHRRTTVRRTCLALFLLGRETATGKTTIKTRSHDPHGGTEASTKVKIKSLQLKIAGLAGLCLLGTAAALVGFGTVASRNSEGFVQEQVGALLERGTRSSLQALARAQAGLLAPGSDGVLQRGRVAAGHVQRAAKGGHAGGEETR